MLYMRFIEMTIRQRKWTKEETDTLISIYSNMLNKDIAEQLDRTVYSVNHKAYVLGLKKDPEFIAELKAQQMELMEKYRFLKGNISYNKGKKMSPELYAKVSRTFFKKGNIPHNTNEDGQEVVRNHHGVLYHFVKVNGRMQTKNRVVWELHHGKIPSGYNIIFKDGNTLNCDISNLECVTNAALMQRNGQHNYPELREVIRLKNKLKTKLKNKNHGKKQNQ